MRLKTLFLTLLLLVAGSASADALDDAKSQGLVGEQASGYLGVVQAPGSPTIQALVERINERRRTEYRAIAERNGIALADVEILAGARAIERTPAGQFIRPAAGAWRPK